MHHTLHTCDNLIQHIFKQTFAATILNVFLLHIQLFLCHYSLLHYFKIECRNDGKIIVISYTVVINLYFYSNIQATVQTNGVSSWKP